MPAPTAISADAITGTRSVSACAKNANTNSAVSAADAARRSREAPQDYRSGYETSGWDDNLDTGQRRYAPFHVGTGMGLGTGSEFGREREFGQGYGRSSGYGGHSGWDLGTHQRDIGGSPSRQSFRGMGPSHYKRADERIRDDIYERLTDSHVIDARSIMVDVNEGNVTLTGTVNERRMRYAAEDLVERVGGVANINNQLRVQAQETTLQQPSSSIEKTKQEDTSVTDRRSSLPCEGRGGPGQGLTPVATALNPRHHP